METLIEISKDKWSELRDLYRNDWPKNAVAFCLLDTKISYPNLTEEYEFKLYCPDGNISNGMIAITNQKYYELMIHPLDNDKMERALAATKIIDWSKNAEVSSASRTVEECLKRIKPSDVEIHGEKVLKHILHRHSPRFENLSAPPNTYADHLKSEHIKLVDETWTYYNKNSHKFFETLMRNNLTYVLYSLDHKPLAWITIDTVGALTHLYCLEEHRRKGYAEYILKVAINDQLNRGKDVLAYTVKENFKPQMLLDKLKFERFGCDKWLFMRKV